MILVGAIVLGLLFQPASLSQPADSRPVAAHADRALTPGAVPAAGTEAALRTLVAGLASGSPDYGKLSPEFAGVVRRDLPMTHPLFRSMGALKSATFLGRGDSGDDFYNLVFAKGGKMADDIDITLPFPREVTDADVAVAKADVFKTFEDIGALAVS